MKEKAKIAEGRQSDEFYMGLALEEARLAKEAGEVPVGAVIADGEGRVVAAARNKREELHDATAHAELIAVQEACAALHSYKERGWYGTAIDTPSQSCARGGLLFH